METTPAKFLVLNETTGKIHRITCKRKGDGAVPLDLAPATAIAVAAPATCCRPKGADELIAAAQETEHAEKVKAASAPKPAKAKRQPTDAETHSFPGDPAQKEPKGIPQSNAEVRSRRPQPTADPVPLPGKKVFMTDDGHVSLQYWNAFGRDGGIGIANAVGVSSFADSRDMSLLLTNPDQERVDQAAQAIINMWVDGFAAFKVWRKTDETYKSLIRTTNVRYRAEQAWLRDYASAFAVELGGVL